MKETNKQLAISSIKVQDFKNVYPLREAFLKGTIFKDLDKPFTAYKRGDTYES